MHGWFFACSPKCDRAAVSGIVVCLVVCLWARLWARLWGRLLGRLWRVSGGVSGAPWKDRGFRLTCGGFSPTPQHHFIRWCRAVGGGSCQTLFQIDEQ